MSFFTFLFSMRNNKKITKNKLYSQKCVYKSGIIYSMLSAVTKILFPYVPNYGSNGRDAVKTPFSTPFYSIQYIKTISYHKVPLQ